MNRSRPSFYCLGLATALAVAGCGGGNNNSQSPNTAPLITGMSAVTVDEDTVVPLTFTINDAETPVANLTVTATSSDATIVPASNVALSGSSANRVVTLTPLPDVVGTTTITVTVKDADGLSSTASVPVTFREVRVDFPNYSRQAFLVPDNGTPLTVTREKFNFTGDADTMFNIYKDLIGP